MMMMNDELDETLFNLVYILNLYLHSQVSTYITTKINNFTEHFIYLTHKNNIIFDVYNKSGFINKTTVT